ncbi:MAG: MFS transporter [Robiginitomaculum sp.]|nr:MFS transporter [Robiginitomaculum sp.]
MSVKQAGALMTQRRFWPLFVLLQTGTFNDNVLKNALIGLITFGGVVFLSGLPSGIRVPVAAFIFTGPFLLVCAVAGQIADKVDRGVILKTIKRCEIGIMLIAALGFWFVNIWVLAFALFLMGAQSAFFSPTKNAVLPQWLESDELITGNSILNGFVFVFILVGMVGGLFLVGMEGGPRIVAVILLVFALVGWGASEFVPPAPAPKPELKINFEPVTATINVLRKALDSPHVLRPMLGIAWFYGLSTMIITTLPDYVANVMGYDRNVLIVILVFSTLGILIGSLLCMVLAKGERWGKESVGLSALGICGVIVFVTDLYFNAPSHSVVGPHDPRAGLATFFAAEGSKRMIFDITMASIFNGLFVVPLQAMAQRRADPAIRARLMSAGAVLLNLFVNVVTFALIGMAALALPPKSPFLIIIFVSLFVAAYSVWRTFHPIKQEAI